MIRLTDSPETLLALYRISQAASCATAPREAYKVIMEEIQRLFAPHAASLCLISPNTSMLEIEYALGYPAHTHEMSIHLGKGISGRVAFNGSSINCPDVSQDPRYLKLVEGVASKIVSPMFAQGQIIGVITVDRAETNAFSDAELAQLDLVADEASRSLQSIWAQRQLAQQSDQLKALIAVGQNIVSHLEVQSLWESVAEAAMQLTGARLCTLQLYDAKSARLRAQTIRPANPEYLASIAELQVAESLAGSAVRTKRQVEFFNITTPDFLDLKDVPRNHEVTSCLSTPMLFEGEVIGVINVFTQERHRFANSERRFQQAFASLSAVAAENANLYARVCNSEERLRKSERLTTLGLLAAEIAHEIRNPLTVIKLLFSSLDLQYPLGDPRNKDKQVIREKIDQLEEIVSKVLSFGKAPSSLFTHWDIDELIADTCLLVRHKMTQLKIELRHHPLPRKTRVNGNKGQLQQVLLNLIINAADAMPDGGRLTLSTAIDKSGPRPALAILVEDTGTGIPANLVDSIFDSFLTGKAEGTGLGLSIVKRILRSHHGDIKVAKTSPAGTTMRIELPLP